MPEPVGVAVEVRIDRHRKDPGGLAEPHRGHADLHPHRPASLAQQHRRDRRRRRLVRLIPAAVKGVTATERRHHNTSWIDELHTLLTLPGSHPGGDGEDVHVVRRRQSNDPVRKDDALLDPVGGDLQLEVAPTGQHVVVGDRRSALSAAGSGGAGRSARRHGLQNPSELILSAPELNHRRGAGHRSHAWRRLRCGLRTQLAAARHQLHVEIAPPARRVLEAHRRRRQLGLQRAVRAGRSAGPVRRHLLNDHASPVSPRLGLRPLDRRQRRRLHDHRRRRCRLLSRRRQRHRGARQLRSLVGGAVHRRRRRFRGQRRRGRRQHHPTLHRHHQRHRQHAHGGSTTPTTQHDNTLQGARRHESAKLYTLKRNKRQYPDRVRENSSLKAGQTRTPARPTGTHHARSPAEQGFCLRKHSRRGSGKSAHRRRGHLPAC